MTTPITRRGRLFPAALVLCIVVGSAVPASASKSAEADGHGYHRHHAAVFLGGRSGRSTVPRAPSPLVLSTSTGS